MSGLEVIGVVLGTIPLLVSAFDTYSTFMRDRGKTTSELKSLKRNLLTERAKLYNVCESLIVDIVPTHEIEPMLQDPFGPLWKTEGIDKKIRNRLQDSYDPFNETVAEIKEALESVMLRLSVHVTDDGKIAWLNQGWKTRELKKLLYRLDRKDYEDAVLTISRGTRNLEDLTRLSIRLQPYRRTRSHDRIFNVLRNLSTSIHRALYSSILCTDRHDIGIELKAISIEIQPNDGDDKILANTQFIIIFSFEEGRNAAVKCHWEEIYIKTELPAKVAPLQPSLAPDRQKNRRRVLTAIKEVVSSIIPKHTLPSNQVTTADLSRAAAGVIFADATYGQGSQISRQSLDLCVALRKGRLERPACYGYLMDTEHVNLCYKAYPSEAKAGSNEWSIITLKDIFEHKFGLRSMFPLVERLHLALIVASSTLQLSETPWLSEMLTCRNLHFFKRGHEISYKRPFLLKRPTGDSSSSSSAGSAASMNDLGWIANPTLFRLGILLLEIMIGQTLDKVCEPIDVSKATEYCISRDFFTASRVLEEGRPMIDHAYKAVVQRCIHCTKSTSLDNSEFRQDVYSSVVVELEKILKYTGIGS